MVAINKHYLSVGNRRVHYRRAGAGPALVALHASPVSSEVFEEVHFPIWSKHFTVIAIDTPGQGLSDALEFDRQPLIEDYADALKDTLDALQVKKCSLYGRHTGASIAVEFARRHPSRSICVVTDGFPLFTPDVRDDYLKNYLSEIKPDWTGAYLIWWWFRYREQHVFWPWNKHQPINRADQDLPDLEFLQRGTREILVAGNNYMNPYRAAFLHEGLPAVSDIIDGTVPVCFGGRPGDSVFAALKKMPTGAWVKEFPRDKIDATSEELEIFLRYRTSDHVPPAEEPRDISNRVSITYVGASNHRIAVRYFGTKTKQPPLLLLHPIPGGSKLLERLMYDLGRDRYVIAPDLPGNGDSYVINTDQHSMQIYAAGLENLLKALKIDVIDLYGRNGGASAAVELTARGNIEVRSLMLDGPMALTDQEQREMANLWAPDIQLSPNGYHLTTIWHHLRDQQLFFPWYKKTLHSSRFKEVSVDETELHNQLVESIKQIQSYTPAWRAVLDYPLRKVLASLTLPIWIGADETDIFVECLETAGRVARVEPLRLSMQGNEKREALHSFLGTINNGDK